MKTFGLGQPEVLFGVDERVLNLLDGPSDTYWGNLGYWEADVPYPHAARAFARLHGAKAKLGPGMNVLDIGFGCGDQVLLWLDEFNVDFVLGLNISKPQVDIAKRRLSAEAHERRVELHCASHRFATTLKDAHYHALMLVDCAYHLKGRCRFFKEVFPKLRPGGALVMTDFAVNWKALPWWAGAPLHLALGICGIPYENMVSEACYRSSLARAGFTGIEFTPISSHVFAGFIRFVTQKHGRRLATSHLRTLPKFWVTAQLLRWVLGTSAVEYSLIYARKPA